MLHLFSLSTLQKPPTCAPVMHAPSSEEPRMALQLHPRMQGPLEKMQGVVNLELQLSVLQMMPKVPKQGVQGA